jgi:hypothetical protein
LDQDAVPRSGGLTQETVPRSGTCNVGCWVLVVSMRISASMRPFGHLAGQVQLHFPAFPSLDRLHVDSTPGTMP